MDSDAAASRSAFPQNHSGVRHGALLVRLREEAVVVPEQCACCGAGAWTKFTIADGSGRELLIGYCEICARHVARAGTRKLAARLSAALLGVSLAAGLPIALPFASLAVCVFATLLAAALPVCVVALGGRALRGHAAAGSAAEFRAPGALVCRDPSFGERLAAAASAPTELVRWRPRLPLPELAIVFGAAGLLAPAVYAAQHPQVRVLNLAEEPATFWVDGHLLGRVEASSAESPAAGRQFRVPAGQRELESRGGDGAVLARARVSVLPSRDHLYAPLRGDVCFWLERTAYGREQRDPEYEALEGVDGFWPIPAVVQGWFVPSPPPAEGARTTGGTATVLRQSRCDDRPF